MKLRATQRHFTQRRSTAMAILCLVGLLATPGFAQKPQNKPKQEKPPKPSTPAKDPPQAPVVANVHVNVKIDVSTTVNVHPSTAATSAAKGVPAKDAPAKDVPVKPNDPASKPKTPVPSEKGAPAAAAPDLKKSGVTSSGGKTAGSPSDNPPGDDLFELHIRLRRTAGGVDVLLAGTVPTPQTAATAAERINQVKAQGMVGLLVLPLIVKSDPATHRALRDAWSSIQADARGPRLALTASIPHEAITAAAKLAEATRQFVNDLLGRK